MKLKDLKINLKTQKAIRVIKVRTKKNKLI